MATLFNEKLGCKIRFCIYFADNTSTFRIKRFKTEARAMLALRYIQRLEDLSQKKQLTARDIAFFVYKKIITAEEARLMTKERVYRLDPYGIVELVNT